MFVGWLKKHWLALKVRFTTMRKTAVKDQLYGAIIEMMNNREYFYKSNIGKTHEYSHWTEDGRSALMEFLEGHTRQMLLAEEKLIKERAKEMTFEALKAKE